MRCKSITINRLIHLQSANFFRIFAFWESPVVHGPWSIDFSGKLPWSLDYKTIGKNK